MTQPSIPSAAGSRPLTLKEYVRDWLRHRIVTAAIPGGSRLVQGDLAVELGVSTTPIREALHDLAAEGLVTLDPHKGALVTQLSWHDVAEIYQIRSLLEPIVMALAAPRLTSSDCDHLDRLWEGMESERSPSPWLELNRAFHRVFLDACGSPRLASIASGLLDSGSSYVVIALQYTPDRFAEANREHRFMIDAARRGDIREAVSWARRHLDTARETIRAHLPDAEQPPTALLLDGLRLADILVDPAQVP